MAKPVWEAKRVDFVPAEQNMVGEASTAKEHAQHRPFRTAVGQRNELAGDDVWTNIIGHDF